MYLSGNDSSRAYPPGRAGFVSWLQDKMPGVYETIKRRDPAAVQPGRSVSTRARRNPRRTGAGRYPWRQADGFNYARGGYQLHGLALTQEELLAEQEAGLTTTQEETSWADRISQWVTPLVGVYQQKKMIDLQLERAKQGLEPLPDDALAAKVKVSTGFDKYIPWIIVGTLGLGALFVFGRR